MKIKIFLMLFCMMFSNFFSNELKFIKLFVNDHEFIAEVAKTEKQKARGLMFRESIPENYAMLFVYDKEDRRAMWMKNTLIPLDFVFLNEAKEIIDIIRDVPPCKNDPCKTYVSKKRAQYVIEFNAGTCDKEGMKKGDFVFFIL